MNDVLAAIQNRYSCRAFTGAVPTNEQLQAIARAATQAPSAMNRQPWRVVVVKDKALVDELEAEGARAMAEMEDQTLYQRIQSRGGRLFYGAPVVFVLAIDAANPTGSALDCGIVAQTIALAATSLGLGSCICGLAGLAFSQQKAGYFARRLAFPEGYAFGMAVLVGTAATAAEPHAPDDGKVSFIG